jgi:hypothetical protein
VKRSEPLACTLREVVVDVGGTLRVFSGVVRLGLQAIRELISAWKVPPRP